MLFSLWELGYYVNIIEFRFMEVLCFGIAKEITKTSALEVDTTSVKNVAELKAHLLSTFPAFKDYFEFRIAVNQEFALEDQALTGNEEIAIIPPVSGG